MKENRTGTDLVPLMAAFAATAYMAYRVYKQKTYKIETRVHRPVNEPSVLENTFKVMQYNILADCYTDKEHSSNLNQSHLKFKLRHPKIR